MTTVDPAGAIVLTRTIRAEWARLRTLRSIWFIALVTTIAVAAIATLVASDASVNGQTVWTSVRWVGMLATLLLLSMATAATTADYDTGGIVPTLQWTPRRRLLLAGRTTVIILAVTITGLIPALAGGALATRLAPAQPWSWRQAVETLAALGFVYAFGALLAVGIGLLLRSTAASIGVVVVLSFVLPILLGNVPFEWTRGVAALLPGTSARKLLIGEGLPGLTDTGARAILAAWAIGSFAIGAWRLLRTDANR